MAASAGFSVTEPAFPPLSAATIEAAIGEVPAPLAAMAEASGGLVHDVAQAMYFAKEVVADEAGCTLLWLQTRPKYGAPCTAILSRQVSSGGSPPQDLARRAIRIMDPRPGAYSVKAPGKVDRSVVDDDGLMAADMSTAALYATTNPRDTRAAAAHASAEYSARVTEEARQLAAAAAAGRGGRAEAPERHRLDKLYLAALQREEAVLGRARWRTLDVDDKAAVGPCMALLDEAGVEVSFAVETRGGVHLLLTPAAIGRALRDLKPKLERLRVRVVTADGREEDHEAVEIKTDCGCPLPGTMQAGFPVTFLDPALLPRE